MHICRCLVVFLFLSWPFTQAEAIDYRTDHVANIQVLSHFLTNPRGVIYFLHGRGGSAVDFSRTADALASEAVQQLYAVVFLESANRALGTWHPTVDPRQSVDIANIARVRALFAQRGLLRPSVPEFAVGFSSGGGFAPYAAQVFGFAAVAVFNARGYERLLASPRYDRPTVFFPGQDDLAVPLPEVTAHYELLRRRGVPTALVVVPHEAHRFTAKRSADLFSFFDRYANPGLPRR